MRVHMSDRGRSGRRRWPLDRRGGLRHGQPPIGRKGPPACRRRCFRDPRARAAAGGGWSAAARRRRVPRGDGDDRATGAGRAFARVRAGGGPLLGSCMGMQLLFEGSRSTAAPPDSGCSPVRCAGWRQTGASCRTSAGARSPSCATRRSGGACRSGSFSTTSTATSRIQPSPRPCSPQRSTGSASQRGRRGNVYGAQSHPEKSSAHGLRLLGNFVAICAEHTNHSAAAA